MKISQLFYICLTAGLMLGAAPVMQAREPVTEAPKIPKGYDAKIKAEVLLVTSETADGKPIVYPKVDEPEVRIVKVTVPPGTETGWHIHPVPAYGYVISGSITVELEDGRKTTFNAGSALAEVVNVVHNGRNTGSVPVEILMVITGEKGTPVAVAKEAPAAAAAEKKE